MQSLSFPAEHNVKYNLLVHNSANRHIFFLLGSPQQHECEKRNTLESRSSLTCKHILVVELAKSVFRSAQKQGLLRQTEQHLFNVKKEVTCVQFKTNHQQYLENIFKGRVSFRHYPLLQIICI